MQLCRLCVGGVPQFGRLQPDERGGEREAGQTAVSWTASDLTSCAAYAPFSLQAVCGVGDSWTVNLLYVKKSTLLASLCWLYTICIAL